MKRKIFSKLLMGAFLIASISSFVSCKDYDDDIKKNTDAIGALQTTVNNLQQALDAAKAEANTAHAAFALKTQVASDIAAATKGLATEDAVAQVKKANEDAVAALAAEIKALATIDALEAAKKEAADALAKAMEGTATKEDLDKVSVAVSAIDSKLDGINTALAETNNNVKANADAIAAAQKNIETQQAAIEALQEALKGTGSSIDDVKGEVGKANQEISSVKGELSKAQSDLAALRKALDGKANQTAIDNLEAKVKELEALKTELSELKSAVTKLQDLSEVKDLMKKADEKVDKVAASVNLLTVFVTKQLKSLVFQPDFYIGGVEATEAPAIVYQPLQFNNTADVAYTIINPNGTTTAKGIGTLQVEAASPAKSSFIKSFSAYSIANTNISWFNNTVTSAFVIGGNNTGTLAAGAPIVVITPNAEVKYHMNPSSVDESAIDEVSIISADKIYLTRAAASAPTYVKKSVSNGVLNVEVSSTYSKLVNNANKLTVLASQVHYKTGSVDTTITSDYAALVPSVYGDLIIADKGASNGIATAGTEISNWNGKHAFKRASQAIGSGTPNTLNFNGVPAAHKIPWNSNGFDLDQVIEIHALHKLFNAGAINNYEDANTTTFKEVLVTKEQLAKWGLKINYSLVEYTTGTEFTEQSNTHAQLSGSILKPWGINESQTNASIGRMPLVRVDVVDTNHNNQLVLSGFVKFEIIADKANDVEVNLKDQVTKYWTCNDITSDAKWSDIEAKVLDDSRIKANGIAKTTFELLYGIQGGTANTNIASETATAGAPVVADTYMRINGEWKNLNNVAVYNGSLAGTVNMGRNVISYVFNTTGTNRTGTVTVALNKTMVRMLLANVNSNLNSYVNANGNSTLANATLNDERTIELAFKFYDVAQGGMPDVYAIFKFKVSKLALTINKIDDYWYASNNVNAKSGYDEIHVSVPVIGETGANVANFQGDFLNTIVKNQMRVAASAAAADQAGYIVADLDAAQRAQIGTAAGATGTINTTLKFVTKGTTVKAGYTAAQTVGGFTFAKDAAGNEATGVINKYLLVPDNSGRALIGITYVGGNTKKYNGTAEVVATITPQAAATMTTSVIALNGTSTIAKDLVNYADHKDLANTLTGHVKVSANLVCDATIPVIVTNPDFDVKFLRPVDFAPVSGKKIFRDATDGGNILNLIDLIKPTDWRELWTPKFGATDADLFNKNANGSINYGSPKYNDDTKNYYLYYQVSRLRPIITDITTNMNGGDLNSTLLSNVTGNAQFSAVTVTTTTVDQTTAKMYGYATNPWAAPTPDYITAGGLTQLKYENNQTTVGTFMVRVPIEVTYYWGTQVVYVDIEVGNTKEN